MISYLLDNSFSNYLPTFLLDQPLQNSLGLLTPVGFVTIPQLYLDPDNLLASSNAFVPVLKQSSLSQAILRPPKVNVAELLEDVTPFCESSAEMGIGWVPLEDGPELQ
jgi:hypothetical protein